MAPHPRILFPFPTNTTECLASCSSACLFYNLCSFPSPPPPPPPSSTPIHLRHFLHLPLFLLVPSSLLILLSFLCLFILLLRRCRSRSSNSTPVLLLPSLPVVSTNPNDHSDQHYVWYIRTVGLDDSAIHSISAWSYKSGDGTGNGTGTAGCAVCLGEFHDGELLRLLPKCGHAFHVPCIDTWLRAHANCPLCRAPVMAPSNSSLPPPPPSPSDQPDDSSDGEGSNTSERNEGVSGGRNRASSSSRAQPVRRSASMGSLPVGCKEGNSEEGSGSKSREENISLDLETVELERSRSCTCNGLFLSR
ncbi:hypothetical protein LUZ60_004295 [Juncus effusus]|nr:hypothetical protein LUZ60_004295 [Juncus effusus]